MSIADNIKIISTPYAGKSGTLAKKALQLGEIEKVHTVNEQSKFCQANINVLNSSSDEASVRIWVSDKEIPTDDDMVESNIVLEADAVYTRTNVIISAGEYIFAKADKAGVIVRIDGFENGSK